MTDTLWNIAMIITILGIGGVLTLGIALLLAGAILAFED